MKAIPLKEIQRASIAHYSLLACKFFLIIFPIAIGIERAPADITMNLCSVAGLIYLASSGNWPKLDRVLLALIAIATIPFVATIFSFEPRISLDFAAGYVRFMLFGFVCYAVIGPNLTQKDSKAYLAALLCISVVFVGFMLHQRYALGVSRLYGTYGQGDLLAGAFVYSIICSALLPFMFYVKNITGAIIIAILLIFTAYLAFVTGERMSALLCVATIILGYALLAFRNKYFALILLGICSVGAVLFLQDDQLVSRYSTQIIQHSPFKFGLYPEPEIQPAHPFAFIESQSGYGSNWSKGLEMFWASPFIGQGPGMYDLMVCDLQLFPGSKDGYCNTHPHSFLISWLAETGLIGALAFIISFATIIITGFNAGYTSEHPVTRGNLIALSLFVMVWFFPLRASMEWWSQRGNLFLWLPIGLLLTQLGSVRLKSLSLNN